MKKVICAVLSLLCVHALNCFGGNTNEVPNLNVYQDCSLNTDYSSLTISLNCSTMTMSPGDVAVRITAKLSNGKVDTLVWESSNPKVATVKPSGSNGIVNFISYGEATIKCSLKSDPTIFAECKVTVISKFETLKFNRATMSVPRIDSTAAPVFWGIYKPTLVIDPQTGDTTHCDTIWARWAECNLNLLSQAVSIDPTTGYWQVTDENGGYVASMPAKIQVITRDLNEYVFEQIKETAPYIMATTLADATNGVFWETRVDGKLMERALQAGSIDETNYIAKMKEAFASYNDYILSYNEDQAKLEDFFSKRDSALAYVQGGKLYKFIYDAQSGFWYSSSVPCGIVPLAQVKLLYSIDDNPYLYSVELDRIVLKPFATAADLNWGLDIEQDEFNNTYKINDQQVQVKFENEVTSIYRLNEDAAPMRMLNTAIEDTYKVQLYADGCEEPVSGIYETNSSITITANADEPYFTFSHWNDGSTQNPRTINVNKDQTYTAYFTLKHSGKCGDNLYWQYNNGILTITGKGAMYNEQPWFFLVDSITTISLPAELTTIGDSAFANIVQLNSITIPAKVTTIGANAFAGCRKLYDIYSLATEPPVAQTSSFVNYNVYLHVPCDNLRDYQLDAVFGSFKYIECMGAEEKPIDKDTVIITPSTDQVTLIWPQNDQAVEYSLQITKDGVVFCTLKFNAQGQLIGIAFAPSRDGAPRMSQAAVLTANGWQFTVTGLNQATRYAYTIDVLDAQQQSIKHYQGEFQTDGATGIEETLSSSTKEVSKFFRNGVLYILRDGKTYDAQGMQVE